MNQPKWIAKPRALVLGIILALGATGWGVVHADQEFFSHGIHAALKLASPTEGPSTTGFAPIVKSVLPNVVNVSTSKVVRTSANPFEGQIPEQFRQFFGDDQDFGNRFQSPRNKREES